MRIQARHRFTVEEYYRMAETGLLKLDARVELLNGEIFDLSPIGPFHGGVTTYLTEIFVAASKGRWQTRVQNSLWLDAHSEPQPDLVLAKRSPDYYRKRHPRPDEVCLLLNPWRLWRAAFTPLPRRPPKPALKRPEGRAPMSSASHPTHERFGQVGKDSGVF